MSGLTAAATTAAIFSMGAFLALVGSLPFLFKDLSLAEQILSDEMKLYKEETNLLWKELMHETSSGRLSLLRQRRESTLGQLHIESRLVVILDRMRNKVGILFTCFNSRLYIQVPFNLYLWSPTSLS